MENRKEFDRILLCSVIVIFIVVLIWTITYRHRPPKIDLTIKGTNYYDIIKAVNKAQDLCDELGIDFYSIQSGANCFTGMQRNRYETSKYGVIYTEVSYCNKESIYVRVYNSKEDQQLRKMNSSERSLFVSFSGMI